MSELQSKYNKDEILNKVAPCSLCCYTCAAKKDGIIAKTSETLLKYHKGYYDFQCKALPRKYKHSAKKELKFIKQLEKFTQASCDGCRNCKHGKFCIKNCFILIVHLLIKLIFVENVKSFRVIKLNKYLRTQYSRIG